MYLVQGTRPDLAFTVNHLSQFNSCYTSQHWKMAKRILRYLKGTRSACLTYKAKGEPLLGYSDASWNPDKACGKSRSGYVFILSGAAISWKSTKQDIIALSTCEAEYVALCEAMKEGKWLRAFLNELGLQRFCDGPTELRCDNQSTIKLSGNPIQHQRSKHINLKYLFSRHEIENGNFKVSYTPTSEMVADSLTKPVPRDKNAFCANSCGLSDFCVASRN